MIDDDVPVLPIRNVTFRWVARLARFVPGDTGTLMTDVDALGRPVVAVWRGNSFTGVSEVAGYRLGAGSSFIDPGEVVAFMSRRRDQRRAAK